MENKTEEISLEKNYVLLRGKINSKINFSHESFGEKFYKTDIAVKRLSGEIDYINLVISEIDLKNIEINEGDLVELEGQIRSYNYYIEKEKESKRKLIVTVFIKQIKKIEDKDLDIQETNKVLLIGHLCKKPIYRKTPFGREISDMMVAVNRNYKKSDYLPVIAWGRNARFVSKLNVGDTLKIEGRFQSRDYKKVYKDGTEINKRAYEISALDIILEEEKAENEKIVIE